MGFLGFRVGLVWVTDSRLTHNEFNMATAYHVILKNTSKHGKA